MKRWLCVLVGCGVLAGGPAAAQDRSDPDAPAAVTLANGLQLWVVDAPGAAQVSFALALPVGWQHDPRGRTGLAEVVRWWLTTVQETDRPGERLQVEVRSQHTLIWHSGPRRDAPDRLDFVVRLLAGEVALTADQLAVALGRARLASDDHSWLLPGSVIRQKAWRAVGRGTPVGRQSLGIPAEIASIDAGFLAGWQRAHYGCTGAVLVVLGKPDTAAWQALRTRLAALPRSAGAPPAVVHDAAPAPVAVAPHPRVDGPFVTAAFAAPSPADADYLPFLVGMLALRAEAHLEFGRFRGMEWKALFPFVSFEYWKSDPLVCINRRGRDGDTVAAARGEIETLLRRVRRTGVRQSALDPARTEIANTLAVPPYASTAGPYLAVRARFLATARCLDWPLDAAVKVTEVGLQDVNRVLRERLAPARVQWFALHPTRTVGRRRM